MLFNPDWEKPAVMSVEGLVAWLEGKDPQTEYTYSDHRHCLVAQYLKANGYQDVKVYSIGYFEHADGTGDDYPTEFDQIAIGYPFDFGHALDRAKKHLSQEKCHAN